MSESVGFRFFADDVSVRASIQSRVKPATRLAYDLQMTDLMVSMLALIALSATADVQVRLKDVAAPSQDTETAPPPVAINGSVPLWEYTGAIRDTGSGQVGWTDAQVAFGPVQIGTKPFLDLYGSYNAELKLRLYESERLRAAFVFGVYRVPTAAESRGIGNLHASAFANPYAPVWLLPFSFAKSFSFTRTVALHWSSTALYMASDEAAQNHLSFGQTLFAEWRTAPVWAVRAHAGITGVRVSPVMHGALSFAYYGEYVQGNLGAGRRVDLAGEQSSFVMLDAALVFQ